MTFLNLLKCTEVFSFSKTLPILFPLLDTQPLAFHMILLFYQSQLEGLLTNFPAHPLKLGDLVRRLCTGADLRVTYERFLVDVRPKIRQL